MLGKYRNCTGKRGIALAEMVVALALLGIVSTMIVSFSAIAKDHVEGQKSQLAFLEETSQIKQALSGWLSQMDEETTVCTVTADRLSVAAYGASAAFGGESLVLAGRDGTVSRMETESVTRVQFDLKVLSADNAFVKCTVTGAHNGAELYEQSFVLALQCGSLAD